MITEDYISFETAKLLKEKGFDEATLCDFDDKGRRWFNGVLVQHNSQGGIACPTLQMAMKWLREVHNLEIFLYHNDPTIINSKWWFEINKYPNLLFEYQSGEDEEFDTYEEACEVAVNYCLINLI